MVTKPQLPKETIKAVFRGLLQTNKTSSAETIILQHYPYAAAWVKEAIAEDAAKKAYHGLSYAGKVATPMNAAEPKVDIDSTEVSSEPVVTESTPAPLVEQKSKTKTKTKATTKPTTKPITKLDRAHEIWSSATDRSKKVIVSILVKELGMTESGASSYYYKLGKSRS